MALEDLPSTELWEAGKPSTLEANEEHAVKQKIYRRGVRAAAAQAPTTVSLSHKTCTRRNPSGPLRATRISPRRC
jgi:hypothetical protein